MALYEFGYDDEYIYLVSELVEGATLGELTAGGVLSDRDVARIGHALGEALQHAHARGVIHRDVKPANVMVLAEPAAGAGFAKLTDLGVAHVASADELTATGDVIGTLAYMAPEQAEGQRITAACDVYSLALTLYEAWTGTNPVRARGAAATARRLGMALPPLRSMREDLPADLAEVVDAALDPDPQYRPDPAELAEVLDDAADDLSDEGGLVEPETIERFGLTAVRARTRLMTMLHRGSAAAAPAPGGAVRSEPPRRPGRPGGRRAGRRRRWPWRASPTLGSAPSFSPLAAAAGRGGGRRRAPAAGLAGLRGRVLPVAGHRRRRARDRRWCCCWPWPPRRCCCPGPAPLWSLPALAPLLGLAGVAPMFVGLAALAGTAWRRAGLAAAGFVWLAVAEVLSGRDLLFGVADGTLARARWEGSGTARPDRRRRAAADLRRAGPGPGVGRLRGGAAAGGAGPLGGRRPAGGRGLGGGAGGGPRLARPAHVHRRGPPDRARRRGGRGPRRPGGRDGHPAGPATARRDPGTSTTLTTHR